MWLGLTWAELSQTNEANAYSQKFVEVSGKKELTLDDLVATHEKHDRVLKPKWRVSRAQAP